LEIFALVFNGLIAIGAIWALVLYRLNKLTKKKTAATLLINQIDKIEENIRKLKELTNTIIVADEEAYALLPFPCDAWDNTKHILLQALDSKDCEIIEGFFTKAKYIISAREDIVLSLKNTWNSKTMAESFAFSQFVLEKSTQDKLNEYQKEFEEIGQHFIPNAAIKMLFSQISLSSYLSGTTTYAKIRKISYFK